MDFSKCNICLSESHQLIDINEVDTNNVKWYSKIISIAPQLEEIDDYLICKYCIQKLEEFIQFKQMLLNLLNRWKSVGHSIFVEKDSVKQQNTTLINHIEFNNPNEVYLIDDPQPFEYHNENCESPTHSTEDCDNKFTSYKCNNCSNFYSNNRNLQAHQKYCLQLESDVVPQKIDNKPSQIKSRGRKSLRTFICEVCRETFNKVSVIIDHYVNVHAYNQKNIKPYACEKCEQKFSTLSLLLQHLKYHSKDRSKMCPICGKSFITSNDLMSHQYTHLNRRNYKCTECSKAFNTNKNLRTHILVVHTDRSLWRYHCTVCDKRFPQKSNFDQHCRRHTGDKQHVCHICQKPFISNSELKRHIMLHSNIKLFKCDPCGTEYKTKRSYEQHKERKHSNTEKKFVTLKKDKKFGCHICPSKFFDRAKLLKHLSRHSAVKPHSCSLCEKRFSDKSYLKQHVKVIHKLNVDINL